MDLPTARLFELGTTHELAKIVARELFGIVEQPLLEHTHGEAGMEPSMGRVVIYREPLHGLATGAVREHPAFITRVVGPEIVNLLVMWGDERRPSPVLSVRLIGTFEDPGDVMTGWSWPEIKREPKGEDALKAASEQAGRLIPATDPTPGAPQESAGPMAMPADPPPEQPAEESPSDQVPASDPAPTP